MSYSIEHDPDCLFDENYIEDGSWSRCSCLHSPLENYGSPEYDVQRWDHCYWWEDGMQPVEDGPWVLAWEAEAHEKAAVQQAIRNCIAAVEEMPYYYMRSEDDGMGSTHGAIKANTINPLLETSKVVAALRALQDGVDNVV